MILKILKKSILKAKECGADAIKLQSYEAETMTPNVKNKHFLINDKSIWRGSWLKDLYKAETPFKWYKEIFSFQKNKNFVFCFFDTSAVDLSKRIIAQYISCISRKSKI